MAVALRKGKPEEEGRQKREGIRGDGGKRVEMLVVGIITWGSEGEANFLEFCRHTDPVWFSLANAVGLTGPN